MGLTIDISSYNGAIDWQEVFEKNDIEKVILRVTTKNGNLDVRFIQNLNGVLLNSTSCLIDIYKFSYAKNYGEAVVEAKRILRELAAHGLQNFINRLWLDIEDVGGVEWTTTQCEEVICAYEDVLYSYSDLNLGIYANYHYAKNILPKWLVKNIWLARWTNAEDYGEVPMNVVLWQYTNKGKVAGIPTSVDLSRYVENK